MKVIVINEKEEKPKPVEECDGGCDGGGFDAGVTVGGMGEVTIGGPDRFDLGFGASPFTQAAPPKKNKKGKKIKISKRRK